MVTKYSKDILKLYIMYIHREREREREREKGSTAMRIYFWNSILLIIIDAGLGIYFFSEFYFDPRSFYGWKMCRLPVESSLGWLPGANDRRPACA